MRLFSVKLTRCNRNDCLADDILMKTSFLEHTKIVWQQIWANKGFRRKFLISWVLVLGMLAVMPTYFPWIQRRQGIQLHDPVLAWLPSVDVSVAVFVLLWGMALLLLWRCVQSPLMMLRFLAAYATVTFMRAITIYLFPLEPPLGLVAMEDPLTNAFYGEVPFVTKDLFFSGHTSTMYLIFLVLERKADRTLALVACCLLGVLLALQHVHYTIDIVFAPIGTYLAFWLSKKLL